MGARTLNKLTATQVRSVPSGKYSDGGGLWLFKRDVDSGRWVQRFTIDGKRHEMGLGSLRDVTLKEAREASERYRRQVRQGIDPIQQRGRDRREARTQDVRFRDIASDCFEARKAQLKNEGKAARWLGPIEMHIFPKLGDLPVGEIDQNHIKQALEPIWHTKPSMAEKALQRVGIVLNYAEAAGLEVDSLTTKKARALLGKQRHKPKHHAALPWRDMPAFYASLEGTPTHLAMKFLILTATRSSETRLLHLNEVDGDLWVIPGDRMKGGKEHRVPLSTEAINVLNEAAKFAVDGHPFVGPRGKPLSDATLSRMMERRGMEARPHGFRSSFRTWCAEETNTPEAVAEAALAHTYGSKVVQAYRRTDHLDERRELMQRWSDFVSGN